MAYYIVSGQYANHLERAVVDPSPTPAEDMSFPVENVSDGRAGVPFRFGSAAANPEVIADINLLSDPGFEVGVTGWTASAGTFISTTDQHNSGAKSGALAHSNATDASRDVTCRAGEKLKLSWAIYGGGGVAMARVYLLNVDTGHYLQNGGGSWGAADYLATKTTTGWASSSVTFDVESVSTCLKDIVTLRVLLVLTASGTVYFDDVELYPAVTWASVHGHNFGHSLAATVEYSDGGAYTSAITLTTRRDSFYGTCSAEYHRYWKLLLTGTPSAAPWIGEWVLGQYASLTVNPLYPGALEVAERETRISMANGAEWVYLRGGAPQRRLTMQFAFRTDAQYQQWKDTITRGSRGGAYSVVIAPTEMDSSVVILGRLSEGAVYSKTDAWSRLAEFELVEDPLPMME